MTPSHPIKIGSMWKYDRKLTEGPYYFIVLREEKLLNRWLVWNLNTREVYWRFDSAFVVEYTWLADIGPE